MKKLTKNEKVTLAGIILGTLLLIIVTLVAVANKNTPAKKFIKAGAVAECTVIAYTDKEAPNTIGRYQSLLVNCPTYSNQSFTLFVNVERANYHNEFDKDAPFKIMVDTLSIREGHTEYESFIID